MEFQNNSNLSSLSNLNKYSSESNEITLSKEARCTSTMPYTSPSSSSLSIQSQPQPSIKNNQNLHIYLNKSITKNLSKTDALIINKNTKSNHSTSINNGKSLKSYQTQQNTKPALPVEILKLINSKTIINEQDLNASVSPLSNASSSDLSSSSSASSSNSMLFNQSLTNLDNDDFSITNHSQSPPVIVRQVANVRERQVSIFNFFNSTKNYPFQILN